MSSSQTSSPEPRLPNSHARPSSCIEVFYRCLERGCKEKNHKSGKSALLDAFTDFARWYARSSTPFIVFENVWAVGLYNWATTQGLETSIQKPNFDINMMDAYQPTFDIMRAKIPSFDRILAEPVADALLPTQLGKLMDAAWGGACSCDGTRMKTMILELVSGILPERRLDPPLSSAESKELARGWNHPQLLALLIPAKHLVAYKEDSAMTIAEINDGSLIISGRDFPAFLYPLNNNYNPKRPQDGLFRGTLWMHTFKAMFTGPSSAASIEFSHSLTRTCQAARNRLTRVTAETIAYSALHTYFAISSAKEWRANMGTFDKKEFFDAMVAVLRKENRWPKNLFAWANSNIFGHIDGVIVPAKRSYEGPSDVDIFLQQINGDSSSEADDGQENAANGGNRGDPESEAESNAENAGDNGGDNGSENDGESDGDQAQVSKRRRLV